MIVTEDLLAIDGTITGGYAYIDTNDILGNKQQDTLKVAASWEDQDPITVDVIIDAEKWMADYPCDTE